MNLDFEDEWYGWRLRGRHLVSEDGQRMTGERLRGLMWCDKWNSDSKATQAVERPKKHGKLRLAGSS